MRNDKGSDPWSQLCSALAPLFLFSFTSTMHGQLQKTTNNVGKFAQARCSSPRRIMVMLKASTRPGKLQLAQANCLLRAEDTFQPRRARCQPGRIQGQKPSSKDHFSLPFGFVSRSNKQSSKPIKSWINLSYLNNNISKCTIYINNQM